MLREELDRIDSVPMLSELAGRILKMVDDPQVTSHKLAAVVSRDQSLVTSILRIVNSAYFGFHWRITSVSQAVVLLGFRTIRNLVLAATVMKSYSGHSRVAGFDRTAHWRHSIGCGSAATVVAKRWRLVPADEAFLAGLVHDIGRVIMDQYFPEEFEESLELQKLTGDALVDLEERVFGMTHAAIGAHIGRKWKLPDNVVNAIGDHHGPGPEREWSRHAALVHVADVMARRAGMTVGDWPAAIDPAALQAIGVAEPELSELEAAVLEEYERSNVFEVLVA